MVALLFLAPLAILLIDVFRHQYTFAIELSRISAGALFFLLAILGWGSVLSRRQIFLIRFVIGLGVLYGICVFLALLHQFRPVPLLIFTISGAAFGLFTLFQNPPRIHTHDWPLTDRILLYGVFILAGVRIVFAWTPLISYDNLVYQFFTPAQYLSHGGFLYIPWNVYTNSPMALQMTLGSSLAFDASGETFKMLITLTSFSMPIAVAIFLWEQNRTAALLAALFALGYPAFWMPDTLGTIDLAAAGLLVIGIYWLREAKNHWLTAGIALGLALASRYQMIVILLPALIFVLAQEPHQLRKIVMSLGLTLLITAPWLIKNSIYTGNPFFPALYEKFGGVNWSIDQANRLNYDVFGLPLKAFPPAQWIVKIFGVLLVQPYNGMMGILLLLTSLFSLLLYSKRAFAVSAAIGLTGVVLWGILHPVADVRLFRFNAPGILFVMIAAAGYCLEKGKRAGVILGVIAAATSLPFAFISVLNVFPVYATVTDGEFRKNFQQANAPGWSAIEKANALDPRRTNVLLLAESRGFLLKVPCISPSAFNSPQVATLFQPVNSPDQWTKNFKERGITHIVVSMREWKNLQNMKYYGYMNLPPQDLLHILRWLQSQRILYADRNGNALLEVR